MGWFGEQIRERKNTDHEMFEDSFQAIAGAVMGRRLYDALNDDSVQTADAIGEILKYYHLKAAEVPDEIKDMGEVLEYLLRPHGIMTRSVRLERGWYRDAYGAMLGTLKSDGSVVALVPCGISGYRFYDRKNDKYVTINRNTEKLIEEDAIAFYKPFPLKSMSIVVFLKYILEQMAPSDLAMLVAATMAATMTGMLMPRLNAVLFSKVLMSHSISVLSSMAVYMICASLSASLFGLVRDLASKRIITKMNLSVEAAAVMRVLSLPASFFKEYSSGELADRLNYISSLAQQLVGTAISMGLTSVFSLAYISQIFVYTPSLVIPSLLILLSTTLISLITVVMQIGVSRKRMEYAAKESGLCHSLITGIQKIRLAGAEKRAFSKWGMLYSRSASLAYNPPLFLKLQNVFSVAVTLVGTMILYYGAVSEGVSVPEYYAFMSAYGMVSGAFLSFGALASGLAQIKPVLEMAAPILSAVPEVNENKAMVTSLSGNIELCNVTFRYRDDMPPVLDDLSLKIRAGQYVAIVGKTGCGKSTLMSILLGFEKPQKGAVYYDGKDLNSLDLKSLRSHIGSVLQNGKLFMGDIYSNIVISSPGLSLEHAWEAAELAGLADDIRQMPMGMHTVISEGQGGISGGQRQRLMIARAVAPRPRILMFDEATSALDNITQMQVSKALDRMKCTRLVIAHRLSTIKECDRIIVLDNGKIIEDGSYEELIANNGFFTSLVERQRLDDTAYVGKTTAF